MVHIGVIAITIIGAMVTLILINNTENTPSLGENKVSIPIEEETDRTHRD